MAQLKATIVNRTLMYQRWEQWEQWIFWHIDAIKSKRIRI